MKNLRHALFTTLGLVGLSGVASANAFNVNEHDPAVVGRGGAAAASDETPSAIVFNPAGLAHVVGTQVSLSGTLYMGDGWYENAATNKVTSDTPPTPVPSLYLAHRISDQVAAGIGFHFPFGLAISWPDNHPQTTTAQDSSLRTLFISPVVAVNLHEQVPGLSLGGGVDIVPSSVHLERAIAFGDTQGTVDMAADTVGYGFRAGVMYHPPAVPGLKLGLMYRSQVKLDYEGQADFDIADPYRSQLPADGDATTTINLPAWVSGGVAYGLDNLEVEVDAVWINWAKTFPRDPDRGADATSLTLELPGGAVSATPEDYRNTLTWRVGFDYRFKDRTNLRAGFIYDPTPIPTSTQTAQLPDVDRIALTLGASHQLSEQFGLHASVLWIPPKERDSSPNPADPVFHGTYGVSALVLSLGVSGTFGAGAPAVAPVGTGTVARR